MRKLRVLLVLLTLPGIAGAAGDEARGKTLYATCISCHGGGGEGNAGLKAPRLAHLPSVYVVAQLHKFKSGVRGGATASSSARQMAGMATTLADVQAMEDVAAYIATLQGPASAATIQGNIALGRDYYNQFCGACHGPGAAGNPALNSPPLAGADDWYLVSQLQAFRIGARGADARDRTGRQMRVMAAVLPDDSAVADVVAYISSLDR